MNFIKLKKQSNKSLFTLPKISKNGDKPYDFQKVKAIQSSR